MIMSSQNQTFAIVENGIVVNVVQWDGLEEWSPPAGSQAVILPSGSGAGIGSPYSNGTFGPAPSPAPVI
jgi:hypothetical protein